MSTTETLTADQLAELPDRIYLVNDELLNNQIKYHIYVQGSHNHSAFSSCAPSENFHKPRCGQDGRKRYDTDGLIEVPLETLLDHLLPGICRRCLNHLDLPQPDTEIWEADLHIEDDGTIVLVGGDTKRKYLDTNHPYTRDE